MRVVLWLRCDSPPHTKKPCTVYVALQVSRLPETVPKRTVAVTGTVTKEVLKRMQEASTSATATILEGAETI
jgi:hypothetical protein